VARSPIVIIGSQRSEVGLPAGMAVLRGGGTALDAVEAAMWRCEDNRDDHYVGTGGLPNAQGVVELDASVMIGSSRAFGGVGAVRGYPHPISIARAVLEQLPQHCLLVGEGAELFADEQGFKRAELLTEEAAQLFRTSLDGATGDASDGEAGRVAPENEAYRSTALELVRRLAPHDGPWGTINVLALDADGELVVGVSTSGFPWKYPGRVGDSAVPGAGIYCDARFGAAACTGRGELTMRVTGARMVVDALAMGADPVTSCRRMLEDAASIPDAFSSDVRALCLTPDGRHGGASLRSGATYSAMTDHDAAPVILEAALA
jgi:beta-aspartyl-peptidase (threonine type)